MGQVKEKGGLSVYSSFWKFLMGDSMYFFLQSMQAISRRTYPSCCMSAVFARRAWQLGHLLS